MNKRVFAIFGVVVAVGVGALIWKGVIPPKNGVEGTIGVANRYQTQQISNNDVAIDPSALNDLLQSDVVHRLAKDPEFRKMVTSESYKSLVATGEFQRLSKDTDFLNLIGRAEFAKFATSGEMAKVTTAIEAQKTGVYKAEMERSKTATELDKAATTVSGSSKGSDTGGSTLTPTIDWGKVNVAKEYEAIAKSAEFQKLTTASADFAKIAKSGELSKALTAAPELGKVIKSADYQKVIASEYGAKALASPELEKTVRATPE